MGDRSIHIAARPVNSYEAAARQAAALIASEPPEVNPLCRTAFRTHGRRTARSVVLLHGYTNAPAQFTRLGELFFQRGANVLIPRQPGHGLSDRLTPALAEVTAGQLVRSTWEALDIAQGLGERVTVVGLSMGGVLAGWAAQQRGDIDRAGLIAPAVGFNILPAAVAPAAAWLARRLPNRFVWWDPVLKDTPVPPLHAYPRLATRPLAEILYLAGRLQAEARRSPPRARQVVVVTNATDESVDNRQVDRLAASWRRAGAQNLSTYHFEASHGLVHDLIDPDQPKQQVELVYPILLELLDGEP